MYNKSLFGYIEDKMDHKVSNLYWLLYNQKDMLAHNYYYRKIQIHIDKLRWWDYMDMSKL